MKDRIEYHRVADTPNLVLSEGHYSEFTFEPHFHLEYHIGLVVDGVQRQQFQGKSVLLGPGRISVMPPGEIHDGIGYQNGAYTMKTFRISPELLTDFFEEAGGDFSEPQFAGEMVEDQRTALHLHQLYDAIQQDKGLSSLPVEEAWLNLFEPLFAQLGGLPKPAEGGGLSQRETRRVKDYCHANLGSKIKLNQLAALCDLSRYQFLRRFERSIGLTPHAWLIQLRLERASAELRRSPRSIAEVAVDVGFYDQSHFNRAFRRHFGVAPSRY